MVDTSAAKQAAATDPTRQELLAMVKQDPHRPGRERGRLIVDEIPVWAIIQHMIAIGDIDDPTEGSDALIAEAAADYEVSEVAVRAALAYYAENRAAIDALMARNAAAAGA